MAENSGTEQHRRRHVELHQALEELAADWMLQTGCSITVGTVSEMILWSHMQTIAPTGEPTSEAPIEERCQRCGRELGAHAGGEPCPLVPVESPS
jgi:hypothetical protein